MAFKVYSLRYQLTATAPQYFLQCFTDRDTVPFGNLHAPSKDDLTEYAAIAGKYVKHVGIRGVD